MVGEGGMGEARLLRSPVEETESERVVIDQERVDDSGNDRRRERVAATKSVEGLLE